VDHAIVAKTPYQKLRELPPSFVSPAIAGITLILGALFPWTKLSEPGLHHYASGVDYNAGTLQVMIGVGVIVLLARWAPRGRIEDSGALAVSGLGVLAGGLVLVTLLRIHDLDEYSVAWGLYISGLGAIGMIIAGLRLVGRREGAYPPPD
jgi:peptidoglycan/LPS O-acetylase OafA/YrhL